MVTYIHIPSAPLSYFVRCFWYSEGGPDTHKKERLLPNVEFTAVLTLREDELRIYNADDLSQFRSHKRALMSGARTGYCVIGTDAKDRVFGIQFVAGGTAPFVRVPASELANQSVSLVDVWGAHVAELRERLLGAEDRHQMFRIAEQALLGLVVRPLELHPAVSFARDELCKGCNITVASLLQRIGISQRRFIELFEKQVGLTPKVFLRVRRFQRILQIVGKAREVDWAQVALDCGYYDQAHFIHDFREFSGLTPTQYLACATQHLNHVPLS